MHFKIDFLSGRVIAFTVLILLMSMACESPELRIQELAMSGAPAARVSVGSSTGTVNYQILYAGQTINAGTVAYDDVDTNNDFIDDALRITFQAANGWELLETHFYIGSSLTDLPVNKSGNPQPGQFPMKSGALTGQTTYSLTIPFANIGFSCPNTTTEDFFVSAHASMRKLTSAGGYQYESGWGDGLRLVQRGSWAMYNMIYITCDVNNPPNPATTETAFAFDGDQTGCFQNFSEFLENSNRWGWTNGPFPNGNYKLPIYAGAGLCDLTKGIMVGHLIVTYNGSTANFSYQLSGNNPFTGLPYSLREIHLYAGNNLFPVIQNGQQVGQYTIAPGKFPHKAGNLTGPSYSLTVNNLSGDIYIIAHAVVHGFPQL
jgi:hypothetical protein